MAVKTYRIALGTDVNGTGILTEADVTAANRTDGWTSAKLAALNMAEFDAGTKLTSGSFSTSAKPAAFYPGNTANAFITGPLTGAFANTAWTFTFALRCTTASSQRGRMRLRVYKGPNADGSGITPEISGGILIGTTVAAALSTTADQTSVVTWSPGAITLDNEYLFFCIAWEITTAGGSNSADVVIRTGQSAAGSRIVTPDFSTVITVPTGRRAAATTVRGISVASEIRFISVGRVSGSQFVDNFNRANATSLESGMGWALAPLGGIADPVALVSNQATGSSASHTCGAFHNTLMPNPDFQEVSAKVVARGNQVAVLLEYSPGAGVSDYGYMAWIGASMLLYKIDAGALTLLAGGNLGANTFAPGDILTGRVIGTKFQMLKNGVLVGEVTDTSQRRSGYGGIWVNGTTDILDDFTVTASLSKTVVRGISSIGTNPLYTDLIDDFNRADGSVLAGAGAAIWAANALITAGQEAIISGNQLAVPRNWDHLLTKDYHGADADLIVECVNPGTGAISFTMCALETGATTADAMSAEWNSSNGGTWMWNQVTNGGSSGTGLTTGLAGPAAGDTFWLSKRAHVFTLYRKPAGGVYTQVFPSKSQGTLQSTQGQMGIAVRDTTARWDNFRGGPKTFLIGRIANPYLTERTSTISNINFGWTSTHAVAQAFKAKQSLLTEVGVYLRKLGTPTQDVIIEIQGSTAGKPNGVVVATCGTVPFASLTDSLVPFTFSVAATLTQGLDYFIVFRSPSPYNEINNYPMTGGLTGVLLEGYGYCSTGSGNDIWGAQGANSLSMTLKFGGMVKGVTPYVPPPITAPIGKVAKPEFGQPSIGFSGWWVGDTATYQRLAQSFCRIFPFTIESLELGISGDTGIADNLIVEIHTQAGGQPSGTVLGSYTVAGNTISNQLTFKPMAGTIPGLTLAGNNTPYWIVLRRSGAYAGTSGSVVWRTPNIAGDVYPNGISLYYNGTSWVQLAADNDFGFKIKLTGDTATRVGGITPSATGAAPISVGRITSAPSLVDDFNRADGSLTAPWAGIATIVGQISKIVSGHAEAQSVGAFTSGALWTGSTFPAEMQASVIAVSPGNANGGQGVYLDMLGNVGYMCYYQGGTYSVIRYDPGQVAVGSVAGTLSPGDVLGGRVIGNQVQVLKNGAVVLSVTDTTYRRTSNAGIHCGAWNNAVDNFSAGPVTGVVRGISLAGVGVAPISIGKASAYAVAKGVNVVPAPISVPIGRRAVATTARGITVTGAGTAPIAIGKAATVFTPLSTLISQDGPYRQYAAATWHATADTDGTSTGQGPTTADHLANGPWTFECDMKCGAADLGAVRVLLAAYGWGAIMKGADNKIRLHIDSSEAVVAESSVAISDTNWHKVAVTRNGTAVVIMIDGVDVTTLVNTANTNPDTGYWSTIGGDWENHGKAGICVSHGGAGRIANVAIFKSVISPTRLAVHAATKPQVTGVTLVAAGIAPISIGRKAAATPVRGITLVPSTAIVTIGRISGTGSGQTPATVQDDFNRADGALGANWQTPWPFFSGVDSAVVRNNKFGAASGIGTNKRGSGWWVASRTGYQQARMDFNGSGLNSSRYFYMAMLDDPTIQYSDGYAFNITPQYSDGLYRITAMHFVSAATNAAWWGDFDLGTATGAPILPGTVLTMTWLNGRVILEGTYGGVTRVLHSVPDFKVGDTIPTLQSKALRHVFAINSDNDNVTLDNYGGKTLAGVNLPGTGVVKGITLIEQLSTPVDVGRKISTTTVRGITVAPVGVVPVPVGMVQPKGLTHQDNFNRANGAVGSDWTTVLQNVFGGGVSPTIISNEFTASADFARRTNNPYKDNARVRTTFRFATKTNAAPWIGFLNAAGSGYFVELAADEFSICWVEGTSYNTINVSSVFAYTSGAEIAFEIQGTTLRALYRATPGVGAWTTVNTQTIPGGRTYAGPWYPFLGAADTTNGNSRQDDFVAETLTPSVFGVTLVGAGAAPVTIGKKASASTVRGISGLVVSGTAPLPVGRKISATTVRGVNAQTGIVAPIGKVAGGVAGADERMLSGANPNASDPGGVYSLGARFLVTENGQITHVRYWAQFAGVRTLSIWDQVTQTKLATVNDTAPGIGFREIALPTPLNVVAGKTYAVTHSFNGAFGYTLNQGNPGSIAPHLTTYVPVYASAADAFPITGGAHNYHTDVVYHTGTAQRVGGITLAPAGAAPVVVGKKISASVVKGVTVAPTGVAPVPVGKRAAVTTVRGITLSAVGVAPLPIGKKASATVVPGISITGAPPQFVPIGKVTGAVSNYRNVILADSPLSYWRLGESAGAMADEKGLNNGTVLAAQARGVTGLLTGDTDKAMQLDGSAGQGVNIGNQAAYQIGNLTLEAWIKTSVNDGTYRTIMGKQFAYGAFIRDGLLTIYEWPAAQTLQSASVADDVRHHVAVVFQEGVAGGSRAYVDGVAVGSVFTHNTNDHTTGLCIGTNAGPAQEFSGVLDDAVIYNSALSPAQIAAHYTAGITGGGAGGTTVRGISIVPGVAPVPIGRRTATTTARGVTVIPAGAAPVPVGKRISITTVRGVTPKVQRQDVNLPATLSLAATMTSRKSYPKNLPATLTLTPTLTKISGGYKGMSANLTVAPTMTRYVQAKRVFNTGVALTPLLTKLTKKPISAAFTLTPTMAKALKYSRVMSAVLSLPATQTLRRYALRTLSASLTLTSTLSMRRFSPRALTTGLTLLPALAKRTKLYRQLDAGLNFIPAIDKKRLHYFNVLLNLDIYFQAGKKQIPITLASTVTLIAEIQVKKQAFSDYILGGFLGVAKLLNAKSSGVRLLLATMGKANVTGADEDDGQLDGASSSLGESTLHSVDK